MTRIMIDVCRDGWTKGVQLGITALNADGVGHGYRIAGPKYNGSQERLLSTELDERDAREIREYLDRAFPSHTEAALRARVEELTQQRDDSLVEDVHAERQRGEQPESARALRAELASRPSRAEVLREAADAIDRDSTISAAGHATDELRRMADATERDESS